MSDRRLFALSDPHLSLAGAKPMAVFGSRWDNHVELLRNNWSATVDADDIVLVPGDISWGMRLDEAMPDLRWLAELPGRKVLLRGNHDYWWQGIKKLRSLDLPGMYFIQNDSLSLDGVSIGGARLWDFPGIRWGYVSNADNSEVDPEKRTGAAKHRDEDPEKIRAREMERLRLSLASLDANAKLRVAMTHFPPLGEDGEPGDLTDIIGEYPVDICVFGHVHALIEREHPGADIVIGGTRYVLAASDYLEHRPKLLAVF